LNDWKVQAKLKLVKNLYFINMRTVLFFFLFAVHITLNCQNSFELTIATDEYEELIYGTEDNNNCVVLAGRIGSFITEDWDPYLLKVYPNGDTLSRRIFTPGTNDYFTSIEILEDNNYLFIGNIASDTTPLHKSLYVCKMDTALNIIFEKSYDLSTDFYFGFNFFKSCIDFDQNIILGGAALYNVDNRIYHPDFSFAKLNQQGDTLLTKTIHFVLVQEFKDIIAIPGTKDYMCMGGLVEGQECQIRLDSIFNILEINPYYTNLGQPYSMKWINDTSYLLTSQRNTFTKNPSDIGMYILDTNFNYLNQLRVGKPDTNDYPAVRQSIGYVNDTTIYIGGMEVFIGFWQTIPNALELYVVDRDLNLLGYKEFGDGWANYRLWGILPTSDMGCMLYATEYSEDNYYEYDVKIIKVRREDIEIETSPITSVVKLNYPVLCNSYPNPVKSMLNIPMFESASLAGCRLQIFNSGGKIITDRALQGYGNTLQVNVSNLNPGIYVFNIVTKDYNKLTGKFIKQ